MVTLAHIFRQHAPSYLSTFAEQILPSHKRAINAILQCRTEALGGHVYTCDACNHTEYRYHSCRNRHCPQCQGDKAQQWLANQQNKLLPVPYFLLTFTLPAELRLLARSQQKLFYNLLFRVSAMVTQQLALDPRRLGGTIGMVGILHTWGRNLSYHPHVHYLVPAGAWDGTVWRYGRHKRFLLPVKMLSILFRAKFRDALKRSEYFDQIPASVWTKDWVVHCQPVGRGKRALTYLAAYVFRVALSNHRLVSVTETTVSFRYRPSGSQKWRLYTLDPTEFIRRFLQHVLPKGFVKVRYYGFFSPGQRQILAQICNFFTPYRLLEPTRLEGEQEPPPATPVQWRCPNCGGLLYLTRVIPKLKPQWQPP